MVSLTDYVKLLEGLSFPYDWSNPQIADEVQIAKVLDKARFDDISRTTAPYGPASGRTCGPALWD